MARTRVVLNRAEFGRQVTGSSTMAAHLEAVAAPIAAAVGGTLETITVPAAGGGTRVRVRIANGSTDVEEADSNRLTAALASRLPLS